MCLSAGTAASSLLFRQARFTFVRCGILCLKEPLMPSAPRYSSSCSSERYSRSRTTRPRSDRYSGCRREERAERAKKAQNAVLFTLLVSGFRLKTPLFGGVVQPFSFSFSCCEGRFCVPDVHDVFDALRPSSDRPRYAACVCSTAAKRAPRFDPEFARALRTLTHHTPTFRPLCGGPPRRASRAPVAVSL